MERRSFVRSAGIAGVLATGVAPAVVNAQASVRWRLTSSFPKSLDTLFGVNDVFAKKVSDMTGGKFVISTHAAGEIVPTPRRTTTSARTRPSRSAAPSPSA
jgi:TRAP-type mannitol/chloroaromatic compound transport system substrate-binding protein